jgi:DNA-binding NarL/FixJ family response regulator
MDVIQLAISDAAYAAALRQRLERSGNWEVRCVDTPNWETAGVVVVDAGAFERLPRPLPHPERVVLVTTNDPDQLARAWEAGIASLVYQKDSLDTALLAIMAARLRAARDLRRVPTRGSGAEQDPQQAPSNGAPHRQSGPERRRMR